MGRSKLVIHWLVKYSYLDLQNVFGLGILYITNTYKKTGRVRTDFITLTGWELFFTLELIQ